MYESVEIKRIASLSFFKLLWIGCTTFGVLLGSALGLLACFGVETRLLNGTVLDGLIALVIGPIFGVIWGACFAWFCWCPCAVGLWIYSRYKNVSIKVEFSRKTP